jgi:hypothetical protein
VDKSLLPLGKIGFIPITAEVPISGVWANKIAGEQQFLEFAEVGLGLVPI